MKVIFGLGLSFLLFTGIAVSAANHQAAAENPKNLTTTNEKQPDDGTITSAIKGKFEADEIVRQTAIDVATSNGFVTLNGVVETQAEIDRAIELAKGVDGVRQVNSNLKIDVSTPPNNSATKELTQQVKGTSSVTAHSEDAGSAENAESTVKEGAEKAGTAVKDTAITTDIKTRFAADSTVSATKIKVETTNGVVRLSGTVNSKVEADKAVEIAKKVDGVKKVKSEIVVKPSSSY